MGVGICYQGEKTKLVFDCVSYGKIEIKIGDLLKLKNAINRLSRIINVPISKMNEFLYNYEHLDTNRTIKELELKDGAVILVKFKSE